MYNLDKYLSSKGFGPYISFGQCRITATVADASKEASVEPVHYVVAAGLYMRRSG